MGQHREPDAAQGLPQCFPSGRWYWPRQAVPQLHQCAAQFIGAVEAGAVLQVAGGRAAGAANVGGSDGGGHHVGGRCAQGDPFAQLAAQRL